MSDRADVLKSLVRQGLSRAGNAVRKIGPLERARQAMREMVDSRAIIDEATIAAEVAYVSSVESVSIRLRDGALRFEAILDGGDELPLSLFPTGALFAPRGAKEIRFRVEPDRAVDRSATSDIAGAVGALVARRLWGPFLRDATAGERALVDRRGAELTMDLRTVPSVRKLEQRSKRALMLDVFDLRSLGVENGKLVLSIGLPVSRFG
ncbi:MAG: hypothetical protein AAGF12_31455 [Myxococcota bacterium]